MNKFMETNKKIEKAVVGGYKAVEDAFVGGYKKIENKFVDAFLTPDEPTQDEAKVNAEVLESGE